MAEKFAYKLASFLAEEISGMNTDGFDLHGNFNNHLAIHIMHKNSFKQETKAVSSPIASRPTLAPDIKF